MECKLILEVFRFDCKCDYLPYYKKIVLKIDAKSSVADLLGSIGEDDSSFSYPVGPNAAININGKSLFVTETIGDIRDYFGDELRLDPLCTKHSIEDLRINHDDFDAKFDLLDALVDSEDRYLFKSYIREHYSSPMVNLEEDFVGDGLLGFAYDMIKKYPQRKTEILKSIADAKSGIWLHINISNRLYPNDTELERKVIYLKNAIMESEDIKNDFVVSLRDISRSM